MADEKKVIKGLEVHSDSSYKTDCKDCPYNNDMIAGGRCIEQLCADALEMIKEKNERLSSIVCFENGDQVRIWHCPLCKSEVRIVLKDWNVIEDHLLGIKKVVERPQDIRVVTDDGRVIVLKKEIPTMVMEQKDWSDSDV